MSALQLTLYWNYIFSVKDIYDYPHHEFLKVLFSQWSRKALCGRFICSVKISKLNNTLFYLLILQFH